MKKRNEFMPTLLVLSAGIMWGSIGIFGRRLSALGFNPIQVTALRCIVNALLMLCLMLMTDKTKLNIDKKDIPLFVGNGILSVYIFSSAYQKCITLTSLSTAVVLLYTAPVFVTLMSVILFKEKITGIKRISLCMCIAGSRLVSGIMGGMVINAQGLMFGLISGFGYALYSIFSKIILQKYHAFTNIFYTFLVAGMRAIVTCKPIETAVMMSHSFELTAWAVANGVFTSFLAYLAYTTALTGMSRSKASVIASVEPVVATLIGVFVFRETLGMAGLVGVGLVLCAIIMQNIKRGE